MGTDQSTPLAAMRSSAKLNQEVHSGGTLLNLRLSPELVATKRGQANLGAMIQTLFALEAFMCSLTASPPKPCGTPRPIQRTTGICWSGWLGIPPSLSISPGPCRTPSSPGRSTEAEGELMGGYITQIQHCSVNDGEGIRTLIFLAGCPLVVPGAPTRRGRPGRIP